MTTKRLTLRGFTARDWDAYAAMNADAGVRNWLGGNCLSRDQSWTQMEMFMGQWALRGYGLFALELATDGRFAGFTGVLHPEDWPEPELAYSLAPHAWGQGLATEAAAADTA